MPEVRLIVPGAETPVTVDLPPDEALLFGREPDVRRLNVPLPVPRERVRVVPLKNALVSRNHMLLWSEGDAVRCIDLGSSNGTRVTVSGGFEATLTPVRGQAVVVELAQAPQLPVREPGRLRCERETDFPWQVKTELKNWFEQNDIACSVEVLDEEHLRGAKDPDQYIPLPGRYALSIIDSSASETRTNRVADVVKRVRAWVLEERARLAEAIARREQHDHGEDFIMVSSRAQETHQMVLQAARARVSVILLGESGVGKSRLARCYHTELRAKAESFQPVNCSAYDEKKFLQAALFGAKAGAWTDLREDRVGKIELADRGTLFLDEIGDLPLDLQGSLLLFLDTGRYCRMGETIERPSKARVLCGTNRNLRQAVHEGRFREDLWWRLADVVIEVPPLRERWEDIVARLSRAPWPPAELTDELSRPVRPRSVDHSVFSALTDEARKRLEGYPWPGNLRELESFLRRLALQARAARELDWRVCSQVLAAGSVLLSPFARTASSATVTPVPVPPETGGNVLDVALEVFERVRAEDGDADLKDFMEHVFKPLYVADRLGLRGIIPQPVPGRTDAAMGREVGLKDGQSVRTLFNRYNELKKKYGDLVP